MVLGKLCISILVLHSSRFVSLFLTNWIFVDAVNVSFRVILVTCALLSMKGTLLPIPERVPFRLTADMVDGLGTSGTQGVFQRCAEETLRVLRDGSEVILTVLEVFKYDPLHSWTASELKVKKAQDTKDTGQVTEEALRIIGIEAASGQADEAADRALSAVSRKLDKTLTVEFTVNELIAEATDAGNLACMWMGELYLLVSFVPPGRRTHCQFWLIGWAPYT